MYGLGLNQSNMMALAGSLLGEPDPVLDYLKFWIDPSVTSSMLLSSAQATVGGDVDECVNLAGGAIGNATQFESTSRRPILFDDSGRQVLHFDATSVRLDTPALGNIQTLAVVAKPTAVVSAASATFGDMLRDQVTSDAFKSGPGTAALTDEILWASITDGGSQRSGYTDAVATISADYHTFVYAYNSSSQQYDMYVDGVNLTNVTTNHGVFNCANAGWIFNGGICHMGDFMVYDVVKDASEIAAIVAALETKWGL